MSVQAVQMGALVLPLLALSKLIKGFIRYRSNQQVTNASTGSGMGVEGELYGVDELESSEAAQPATVGAAWAQVVSSVKVSSLHRNMRRFSISLCGLNSRKLQ